MARRGHALHVDRIKCDGYGMCVELLPELLDLDDWGYPMFRTNAIVPERLTGHPRRAVDVCPVLALRLDSVILPAPPVAATRAPGLRRA
jgi:ferredoxin